MKKGNAVSMIFVKTDFSLKRADGHFPLVLILLSTKFFSYAHTYIKKTHNTAKSLKNQLKFGKWLSTSLQQTVPQ